MYAKGFVVNGTTFLIAERLGEHEQSLHSCCNGHTRTGLMGSCFEGTSCSSVSGEEIYFCDRLIIDSCRCCKLSISISQEKMNYLKAECNTLKTSYFLLRINAGISNSSSKSLSESAESSLGSLCDCCLLDPD